MKLAFCLFKYFPYSGLARDFLRIAKECQARQHDLHVYVAEWQGERPEGMQINVIKVSPLTNHKQNAAFYRQLSRVVAKENFDAVVGFNKMPGLDIYYCADGCYIARTIRRSLWHRITPRYRHFYAFERAVFDVCSNTTILSLSEREKAIYQEHYRTPETRFRQLPPVLDRARELNRPRSQVRREKRIELGINAGEHLLLFVGSGFKTKGLDRAIQSIATLPEHLRREIKLLVVGQDSAHKFKRLVDRLNLSVQVRFIGGRDDVVELMTAADLLLHPARNENTGTVLIEAIATGLPVLATDVCGYAPHIINADAGRILRSPFEQLELNRELHTMLVSRERAKWQANGLEYGKNPDLYQMPQVVGDLVEAHVANRRHGGQQVATQIDTTGLYLRDDLKPAFVNQPAFELIMALEGEPVRTAPGRRTIRLKLGDKYYYLKTHTGVGWLEILKNLLYLRLPVLGAMNEWHGIHHLNRLGIDTMTAAGYGVMGANPATRRSFILTDEIADTISLDQLDQQWQVLPPVNKREIRFKRSLITRIAQIVRILHHSGANHRDCYLCHFLLQRGDTDELPDAENARLYLIDLHRMQLRRRTPQRWRIKDLSGIYFSSLDAVLTARDRYRFMTAYRARPLREVLHHERRFWSRVKHRGDKLYAAEARRQNRSVQA